MPSTLVTVPGQVVVTATVDTTGETIARSGVRLTSPSGAMCISGTGDPNGSQSAPIGSLFVRTDVAQLWQNTDGATAWSQVGAGGSAFSGVAAYSDTVISQPGGAVLLPFDQEIYDTDSYHSNSPTDGTNKKFFAPFTGYYHITAGALKLAFTDPGGYERNISIVKYPLSGPTETLATTLVRETNWIGTSVTALLQQGDYVSVSCYTYSGADWIAYPPTGFTMEKVG